jgi:hypothetical protein
LSRALPPGRFCEHDSDKTDADHHLSPPGKLSQELLIAIEILVKECCGGVGTTGGGANQKAEILHKQVKNLGC